jgi:hypothetical protein
VWGARGLAGPTYTRARGTKNEPTSGPTPPSPIDPLHPAPVRLRPVGTLYQRMARPGRKRFVRSGCAVCANVSVCGWPPVLQEEFWRSCSIGRLQSCVRPFSAALRPLALMGVRGLGPHRSLGFENPGYVPGCSQYVGTATRSITPLPLASIFARAPWFMPLTQPPGDRCLPFSSKPRQCALSCWPARLQP